jgi:hypothetical protein
MMKKFLLVALWLLAPCIAFGQVSGAGNIGCPGVTTTGTVANSGTANNTVLATVTATPCPAVLVQLDQTTTITGGAITFNLSNDLGTNYVAVPVAQVINQSTFAQLTNPYTLVASTNQAFLILLNGATYFQVKLTTALTGTGAVTPYVTPIGLPPGLALNANGLAKVDNSGVTQPVSGTVTANQGSPSLIQSHAAVSSGSVTTLANAFTSNNTAGNSIVVTVGVGNNSAVTISDANTNVYNLVQTTCNGTTFCVKIFNATNIKAGANTVTATITSSSVATEVYEFSGLITATNVAGGSALAAAVAADQVSGSSASPGAGTVTLTTGPISNLAPNEFAVAAFAVGTAAQTVTVNSPFNNDSGQQNPSTPSGLFSFVSASSYLGTSTTLAATATMTSEPWAAAIASFKSVLLPVQMASLNPPPVTIATVGGVQQITSKVSAGAGITITNAFPGNTTAGNSILCGGFEGVVTGSVAPVFSDAQGNTFTVITNGAAAAPGFAVALASNIIGGTTDTITETVVSGSAAFTCYELKNLVYPGQAWDVSASLQATSATLAFPEKAAVIPNEFGVVMVGMNAGTVTSAPTIGGVPAVLTGVDQQNTAPVGTAALAVFYSAHANISNAPTFTQSVSISASETYSALLVTIKPASINLVGNVPDPCQGGAGTQTPINISASAQIITGTAGKQIYGCSLIIAGTTAGNIGIVEGTGSTCATGIAGVIGGTTAATGLPTGANSGFVTGSGGYWVFKTVTAGDNVCALLNGTGQTSGVIRYVQQ